MPWPLVDHVSEHIYEKNYKQQSFDLMSGKNIVLNIGVVSIA